MRNTTLLMGMRGMAVVKVLEVLELTVESLAVSLGFSFRQLLLRPMHS